MRLILLICLFAQTMALMRYLPRRSHYHPLSLLIGKTKLLSLTDSSIPAPVKASEFSLDKGSNNTGLDIYFPNHRFWTQRFPIEPQLLSSPATIVPFVSDTVSKVSSERFIELGIALILDEDRIQLIPIHEGRVQPQHLLSLGTSSSATVSLTSVAGTELIVCGFRPRASHSSTGPSELERPVDEQRLAALNKALGIINSITPEELLGTNTIPILKQRHAFLDLILPHRRRTGRDPSSKDIQIIRRAKEELRACA